MIVSATTLGIGSNALAGGTAAAPPAASACIPRDAAFNVAKLDGALTLCTIEKACWRVDVAADKWQPSPTTLPDPEPAMDAVEVTAQGKPVVKVADREHVFWRAYVSGDQLSTVKLGQTVKVYADYGAEDRKEYKGKITWISEQAEFTPKTIQTRDERANLVYAVKIAVENDGLLKLGMYGEVKFN